MNKSVKAARRQQAPVGPRRYTCAKCPGEITVADNAESGLISVNLNGHAKAAHRVCPDAAPEPAGSADDQVTKSTTRRGAQ